MTTSKGRIVFHHPFPLSTEGRSGSSVRPRLMAQAFEELGYKVTLITGRVAQRVEGIRQVASELARGRRFEFVYSESHTLPMPLTESHHLPLHPLLDYRFFASMRRSGVPVGLFYRDAHWRFPELTPGYPAAKRVVVNSFHRFEWQQLSRSVDHLFLPLTEMRAALPNTESAPRVSSLPPGLIPRPRKTSERPPGRLRLLYVGGVTPPLYDLTPLIDAARQVERLSVTICCRKEEWSRQAPHYDVPAEVRVVHAVGSQLEELYEDADAVAILWRPHPYLSLTLPVKLFEALSYGLPVVTSHGTATADFVATHDVGWTVGSTEEVRRLTQRLDQSPGELLAAYDRVEEVRQRHTWRARAAQVAHTLGAGDE